MLFATVSPRPSMALKGGIKVFLSSSITKFLEWDLFRSTLPNLYPLAVISSATSSVEIKSCSFTVSPNFFSLSSPSLSFILS